MGEGEDAIAALGRTGYQMLELRMELTLSSRMRVSYREMQGELPGSETGRLEVQRRRKNVLKAHWNRRRRPCRI